jgi:ribosomal protein L40E
LNTIFLISDILPARVMVIFCHNCGAENPDAAKFCVSCGNNIQEGSDADSRPSSPHAGETACLWCKESNGFKEEEGKMDSKWGVTAHKMKIYTCKNCGYAHLFGLGRTIFDFD